MCYEYAIIYIMVLATATSKATGHEYVYISGSRGQILEAVNAELKQNATISRQALWDMYRQGQMTSTLVVSSEKADPKDPKNADITEPQVFVALQPLHRNITYIFQPDEDFTQMGGSELFARRESEGQTKKTRVKLENGILRFDSREYKKMLSTRRQADAQDTSTARLTTDEQKLANTARYLGAVLHSCDSIIRFALTRGDADMDTEPKDTPLLKPDILVLEQPIAQLGGETALFTEPTGVYLDASNNSDDIQSYALLGEPHAAVTAEANSRYRSAELIEFNGANTDAKGLDSIIRRAFNDCATGLVAKSKVFANVILPRVIMFGNSEYFQAKSSAVSSQQGWLGAFCPKPYLADVVKSLKAQVAKQDPERDLNIPSALRYATVLARADKAAKQRLQ